MAGDLAAERPIRTVTGRAGRIPIRLILAGAELADSHGARPLAEAHLSYVVLDTPKVRATLRESNVPISVLRDALERELGRDCPPSFEYHRSDDRQDIGRYGVVDNIEGRAVVLAAIPEQHPVDEVDVLVSTLFDPMSILSKSIALDTDVDRSSLLLAISQRLDRYKGVTFPASTVVTLGDPVRVPWRIQNAVVARLAQSIPHGVYWFYIRDGDELLLYAEESIRLADFVGSPDLGDTE